MIGTSEIEQMSMAERLKTMELLWKSISQKSEQVHSPEWHGKILRKRLAKVESGKGDFLTLAQLKQRLSKRAK